MALVDVFFTPSILITLAVCLILISVLGLYFIQEINQQNHKINTMVDLVATLSEQMNMLRNISPLPNNLDIGGSSFNTDGNTENVDAMLSSNDTRAVSMVNVSDGEQEDSGSEIEYDESDEEESDEGEEESDEEEDSDDEEESDEEKDVLSVQPVDIEKIDDDILEIPELSADEVDDPLTMKSISIDVDEEEDDADDIDIAVKTLDVVMDYKKASLTKLREIVQSKGLVSDASKMKKADILRVLESE